MIDRDSRASHANLDAASRARKAQKIAALLGTDSLRGARVLEIGTGSGVISAELARLVGPDGIVESVDVVDERIEVEGYRFTRVSGTALPFADSSFDVVISNHVIEHVGSELDQAHHLREISRLLGTDGRYYLASPSRASIVEPHFRLPFLAWLPRSLGDAYVRATGRGTHYDCRLLSRRSLRRLQDRADLEGNDVSLAALQLFAREPSASRIAQRVARIPAGALKPLRPAIPTMIFIGRPSRG